MSLHVLRCNRLQKEGCCHCCTSHLRSRRTYSTSSEWQPHPSVAEQWLTGMCSCTSDACMRSSARIIEHYAASYGNQLCSNQLVWSSLAIHPTGRWRRLCAAGNSTLQYNFAASYPNLSPFALQATVVAAHCCLHASMPLVNWLTVHSAEASACVRCSFGIWHKNSEWQHSYIPALENLGSYYNVSTRVLCDYVHL